jgi:2-keto-myo-inositol isomerase
VDSEQAVAHVLQLEKEYPLVIEGVCPQPDLYRWHYSWDTDIQRTVTERLNLYQKMNAKYLVLPVMSEDGDLSTTSQNLNKLGEIAHQYGIKLGLEPIGHVKKLCRLEDAVLLLENYNAKAELGLILDAFHFFRGGNQLADLKEINPQDILSVHINDAMELPLEVLVGYKHRLYPGEGIFDVKGFCMAIQSRGYDGPYVVELLNEEYWHSDPTTVVSRAFESAKNILT